ncbi:fibronectin type III domain-containing protein 11 [Spea bombifrons]|uniref:fibronectin type III domain-containing protein 11 n=1 Tax=Spea bombifrons TaxID=233779 RepID=UPI00234B792E|nr:fibronectin type III domain-containing protein 11 [Spea bombifrons]
MMDSGQSTKVYPAIHERTSASATFGEVEDEMQKLSQRRKSSVSEFLNMELSEALLERYKTRIELLKKCSFYIEVLPKQCPLGDQTQLVFPFTVLGLVNLYKFQRTKELGATQTKIQLLLLSEYMEQLQNGRTALLGFLRSYDAKAFLTKWEEVARLLSELSGALSTLLSMLVPGRLHAKHRLMSDLRLIKTPVVRLVLKNKMPVLFDQINSVVYKDRVSLKWRCLEKQAEQEKYELRFKLLELQTTQELVHRGSVTVSTNSCEIHHLLSGRLYEFSVHRAETSTLVYEAWQDTIILRTHGSYTPSNMKRLPSVNF